MTDKVLNTVEFRETGVLFDAINLSNLPRCSGRNANEIGEA
jgi:hypothetical protein